jgi:hypothetical protein
MAFRVRNTQNTEQQPPHPNPPRPKIYTQEDIDLIDEKYKEKETILKKVTEQPADPVMNQYKKNLIKEPAFEKEIIIYDQVAGKWKIIKE